MGRIPVRPRSTGPHVGPVVGRMGIPRDPPLSRDVVAQPRHGAPLRFEAQGAEGFSAMGARPRSGGGAAMSEEIRTVYVGDLDLEAKPRIRTGWSFIIREDGSLFLYNYEREREDPPGKWKWKTIAKWDYATVKRVQPAIPDRIMAKARQYIAKGDVQTYRRDADGNFKLVK